MSSGFRQIVVMVNIAGQFVFAIPAGAQVNGAGAAAAASVPMVVGKSAKDAMTAVKLAGLVPKFRVGKRPARPAEASTVYAADPAPGTPVARGAVVHLTVYARTIAEGATSGSATERRATSTTRGGVAVPSIIGSSAKDAVAAIKALGLRPKFALGPAPPSPAAALTVYAQQPEAGVAAAFGDFVNITVYSRGAASGGSDAALPQAELHRVLAVPFVNQTAELIDPSTGKLSLQVTDMAVRAGRQWLHVRRTLQAPPLPAGLLGTRWRLNWERRLSHAGPEAVIEEDAGLVTFTLDETGRRYRSAAGDELVLEGSQAVRTRTDGIREIFDERGRLVEQVDPHDNKFSLSYSGSGRLEKIEGPGQVVLQFVIDEGGRLAKIESSTGSTVEYQYATGSARPTEKLQASSLPVGYAYDQEGRLVGIEHPQAGLTNFGYDTKGRVTTRKWADGTSEQYAYDDASRTRRHINALGHTTTTTWREDYRLAQTTDPLGRTTKFEYDEAGRTTAVTGPTGMTARTVYDGIGRIVEIGSPTAGATRIEYLGNSRLPAAVIGPDENRQTYEYNLQGDLVRLTNTTDSSQDAQFEYFPDGQVKSLKMGTGRQLIYTYDAAGQRDSVTDAAGNTWRYEYDDRGNIVREIDPLGGATERAYDAHGRLVTLTDASGATTRYAYEQRGRLSQATATDPRGNVTRTVYDQRGRVVGLHEPAMRTTRYSYDAVGRLVDITDPAGQTQKYDYDAGGNLIAETNPLGAVTKGVYSELGQVTSLATGANEVTRFEYSPKGWLSKLVDAAGLVTTYDYDDQGRMLAETDAAGRTTQYDHTPAGHLSRVIPVSGPVLGYQYDESGNVTSAERGEQTLTKYEYDVLGRRTKEVQTAGLEITYRYDALGRLLAWQDNQGGSEAREYDAVGRATSLTDAAGATSRFAYDQAGNLLQTTDPLGHATTFEYDDAGQLVAAAEPAGDRARYEYDAAGRVAAVHHPGSGVSSYEYDGLGNVVKAVNPVGGNTLSTYDATGRLASVTDAKGQTTQFAYDAAGRLLDKKFADDTFIRFTYDRLGRTTKIDDGAFPILYTYDEHDSIIRIQYPAIKRTLNYEFNDAGLKTKFVDSEGRVVLYEYDTYDRLSAIKLNNSEAITFAYDPKGRLISVAYPNGVTGAWTYDANDRPTTLIYTDAAKKTIAAWKYAFDVTGNLTEVAETAGRTTIYSYDPSGQLTEESLNGNSQATVRYSYLPGGNRAAREAGGKKVEYRYDEADRLLQAGEETFAYDANGNLIERQGPQGVTRYGFDAQDRLVKVILPDGKEVSYGYAPTGERIWRRDATGLTHIVNDGIDVVAELDQGLKPKATYLHGAGIDQPLAMVQNGKSYYFHADRLGSIRRLTDQGGGIAGSYDYEAFGQVANENNSNAVTSPFTYTGREYEAATGLYYYRARYYDARNGRFISTDPVLARMEKPVTLNRYQYAFNNPIGFIDPFGTDVFIKLTPDQAIGHRDGSGRQIPVGRGGSVDASFKPPSQASLRPGEQVIKAPLEGFRNDPNLKITNKSGGVNISPDTGTKIDLPAGASSQGPPGRPKPANRAAGMVAVPNNLTLKGAIKGTAGAIGFLGFANGGARVVEGINNGESTLEAVGNATKETVENTVTGTVVGTLVTGAGGLVGGLVGGVGGLILGGPPGLAAGAVGGFKAGAALTGGTLLVVATTTTTVRVVEAVRGGTKKKPTDPGGEQPEFKAAGSEEKPPPKPDAPPVLTELPPELAELLGLNDKMIELPVDPDVLPDHPKSPTGVSGELGEELIKLPDAGAGETLTEILVDSPESVLGPPPEPDPNAKWPICPLCGERHDPNE